MEQENANANDKITTSEANMQGNYNQHLNNYHTNINDPLESIQTHYNQLYQDANRGIIETTTENNSSVDQLEYNSTLLENSRNSTEDHVHITNLEQHNTEHIDNYSEKANYASDSINNEINQKEVKCQMEINTKHPISVQCSSNDQQLYCHSSDNSPDSQINLDSTGNCKSISRLKYYSAKQDVPACTYILKDMNKTENDNQNCYDSENSIDHTTIDNAISNVENRNHSLDNNDKENLILNELPSHANYSQTHQVCHPQISNAEEEFEYTNNSLLYKNQKGDGQDINNIEASETSSIDNDDDDDEDRYKHGLLFFNISKIRHTCPMCDYTTINEVKLAYHMLLHAGVKPYKCPYCSYSARQNNNLKQHMLTHTKNKPYKCKLCPYSVANAYSLRIHISKHTGNKSYQCHVCEYNTSRRQLLKQHMLNHDGQYMFKCQFCDFTGNTRKRLIKHASTHMKNALKCILCEYTTRYPMNLGIHLALHGEKKIFKCQSCSYISSHAGNMNSHTMTHTGQKPYNCTMCKYRTTQKHLIHKHIAVKHKQSKNGISNSIMLLYFIIAIKIAIYLLILRMNSFILLKHNITIKVILLLV